MTLTRSFTSVSSRLRATVLFAAGIGLAAVIFELALRAAMASPWWRVLPAVQAQFDAPDPDTGYAHRPGVEGLWLRERRAFVRINEDGLRDKPRSGVAAPGTVRIAVAGDSITEALQVDEDDLFTLQAERMLRDQNIKAEVMNFGLSGALPLQQLQFVLRRGLPLKIDAAVFVFASEDFLSPLMANDAFLPAYVEDGSGNLTIGRKYRNRLSHRLADQWIGHAFFYAVDHSVLVNALYIRAKSGFAWLPSKSAAADKESDICQGTKQLLTSQKNLWSRLEPAWAGRRLQQFLIDVTDQLGQRPVIFLMRGLIMPPGQCREEQLLRDRLVSVVRARLDRAGIEFVDLEFEIVSRRKNAKEAMSGFGAKAGTGHLNAYGHEIYAQVLADFLKIRIPQWKP